MVRLNLNLFLASLIISFTLAAPLPTSSTTILDPIDFIKRESQFDGTGVAGNFNLKGGHKREALVDNTGVAGNFNLKGGHKREALVDNTGVAGNFNLKGGHKREALVDNTGVAGNFNLKGGHKREASPVAEAEASLLPEAQLV